MIPESILSQIQERCDIVETVSAYVPLRQAGRNFKAPCPFHQEKTPSFHVNVDKQIFHCFGCGVGGNVFTFVMKMEKKDFRDVVEMLAEKTGVEIPTDRPVDTEASKRISLFLRINLAASEFYHKTLLDSDDAARARSYFKKREIREETIEAFQLGFAPESWDSFYKIGKAIAPDPILDKSGLVLAKKGGDGYYDRFRNRVIFPILDQKGNCIAFGGRVLDDSVPKYLNSPETEVYVKGRHLYGLFQARKSIREKDAAVVVEGYMDLIACHQAGVENVVAGLGTALTPDQVRLIKRNTNNVFILYDSDKAGEAATMRSLELFIEEGMDVKIVRLDAGHDPDSFLKEFGLPRFNEALAGALTLFDYKLSTLKDKHDPNSLEGKVKIANEMVQLLGRVKNEILRAAWIKELSVNLALSEQALVAEMRKSRPDASHVIRKEAVPALTPTARVAMRPAERMMLGLLLDAPEWITQAKNDLRPEDFEDDRARIIARRLLDDEEPPTVSRLVNLYSEDADMRNLISEATAEADRGMEKKKIYEDCVAQLKRSRLVREREEMRAKLQDAERTHDQNRIGEILRDINELNKGIRKIDEKK